MVCPSDDEEKMFGSGSKATVALIRLIGCAVFSSFAPSLKEMLAKDEFYEPCLHSLPAP